MNNPSPPHLRVIDGGGFWRYVSQVRLEIELASRSEPSLPPTLVPILEEAERGSIRWNASVVKWPTKLRADVGHLKIYVEHKHYRLYFAEPHGYAGLLLALRFALKSGANAHSEQNADIRTAGERLDAWLRANPLDVWPTR